MSVLYRVYVDESGDRGMSAGSSRHFVVAAVIVPDAYDAAVRGELSNLRGTLGRDPGDVLHFQKLTHSQRLHATLELARFPVGVVISVIICKDGLYGANGMPATFLAQPDPMYLWALRLLMERVSWYCDDFGQGQAIVTFAHLRRFKAEKLHDYRAALRAIPGVQIRWSVFDGRPWRVNAPSHVELLQTADIAVSAIAKAVEPDRYGNTEPRYLENLRPVLYRRAPGNITSYGLKTFPTSETTAGGSLHFLRSY